MDVDWAGNTVDRKSTSGFLFLLDKNAVSWSSRKQTSVALSSTEAVYVAAAHASQEVIWLRQLVKDLGESIEEPTTLYEDNYKDVSNLPGVNKLVRERNTLIFVIIICVT